MKLKNQIDIEVEIDIDMGKKFDTDNKGITMRLFLSQSKKLLKGAVSLFASTLIAIATCLTPAAFAQTYPSKPITLVVPFAPGGNVDIVARALAQSLTTVMGQSVVVDNKVGAGGSIATSFVANAPSDGYTLLVATTNTVSVLPFMMKTQPYKVSNFQPISLVATSPLLIEVRADDKRFPDLKSLLDATKKTPESIAVGHSGQGTSNHLAILRVEDAAHLSFNIIPYKGSTPALTDLMGGQLDLIVDQITSSKTFIDAGKLRVLAVLSNERDTNLPGIPTFKEVTKLDLQASTITGLLAPAGTPPAVITALNNAVNKVVSDQAFKSRMSAVGSTAKGSSAKEWTDMLEAEATNSKRLLDAGKLKPE